METTRVQTEQPEISRVNYLNKEYGLRSWLLTKDHKRIALLYLGSVTLFFMLGGVYALLIRLELLTPQGDLRVLLDEGDPDKVDALEQAFFRGNVTEDVLFATGQGVAPWMASVTFGGPDLQTLYIGSLKGTRIPYFRSPVPGLPMVHWNER